MIYNIYDYDYEACDFKGKFLGVAHDPEPFQDGDYYVESVEGVPVGFDDDFLWLN